MKSKKTHLMFPNCERTFILGAVPLAEYRPVHERGPFEIFAHGPTPTLLCHCAGNNDYTSYSYYSYSPHITAVFL